MLSKSILAEQCKGSNRSSRSSGSNRQKKCTADRVPSEYVLNDLNFLNGWNVGNEDMLEVEDLRVAYGELLALQGVSLTIRPGEMVALV
ncbi:MAG: hypothetical protein QOF64_3165, partial [Candidatus Binatota bacterium]|nr:hypothetical protein [Candidatus Binatota bacterium]